jgi:hypothetical protein
MLVLKKGKLPAPHFREDPKGDHRELSGRIAFLVSPDSSSTRRAQDLLT